MRRRTGRALRRPALQVTAVLAVFAVALTLWVSGLAGDPGSDRTARPLPHTPSAPPSSATGSPQPATAPVAPSGGLLTGGSAFGGLSAFPSPLATDIRTSGPGFHTVILEASSDKAIGTVAYQLRGKTKQAVVNHWVASPMFLSDRIQGPGPLAALAVQVAPDAASATCKIIIDGVLASTQTARGPFRVVMCLA